MKRKAILYIRVSTDEQADKGYSQRHQEERLRKFCETQGIEPLLVVKEDYSAKTFDRPEWSKIVTFLKANRRVVDFVLFTKWDRFSRNTKDAYNMINKLQAIGIDPQAIEQPLDLSIPENKLMLAFYLAAPEVENDRRSLNTLVGMRRAKKEGRCVGMACIGYKNIRDEKGRALIVPNEDAHLISKAFEELSTGIYTIEEVRIKARERGLKLSRSQFHRLVRNPIYAGLVYVDAYKEEEASYVQGVHEPLVKREVFDQVQDILTGRRKNRPAKNRRRDDFPLRGFLQCSQCGKTLTASTSRGRNGLYQYYHCQPGCKERIKATQVNEDFLKLLREIKPCNEVLDLHYQILKDIIKDSSKDKTREIAKIEAEIARNKQRIKEARQLMLDKALDAAEYKEIKQEYEEAINDQLREKAKVDVVGDEIEHCLDFACDLLRNLDNFYSDAALEIKQHLVGSIFKNKLVYAENQYRTAELNEAVALLSGRDAELAEIKNGTDEYQSRKVAPPGIEPGP